MKRSFVLLPFFLCLGLIFNLGCQPRESSPVADETVSDTIWSTYLHQYEADSLAPMEKLALNQEMLEQSALLPDTSRLVLLQHRAALFRRQQQYDSALVALDKNLEATRQLGDSSRIADAHFRLGFYHRLAGNQSASLRHYYRAKEGYRALGDTIQAGRMSLNLANLLNALGNYAEAESTAVEGLDYLEGGPQKYNTFVAGLYNALAISTKELRNYPEALKWFRKGLEFHPNQEAEINIRFNTGVVYTHMDSLDQALAILQNLSKEQLLRVPDQKRLWARITDQLGYVQGMLGKDEAQANLLAALQARKELDYLPGQLTSYQHLGEFYRNRNPGLAYEMARNALQVAQSLQNPEDRLSGLELLIKTAPDPRPFAVRYTQLNDSIQQVRQQVKDEFAKVRYESEKNLRNYLIAREEAIGKSLDLERSKNRNLVLWGILGLLVLTGIFIYRYLRLQHKRKELEAVYDTENRISKKVHDELANDIFNLLNAAVTLPDNKKDVLADFVDRLDTIYRKSRDISRDSGDIPTGEAFRQVLSELIQGYSSQTVKILTRGFETIDWSELDANKQINSYRAIQELLVNMKKHSQATLVLLEFKREKRFLHIRYKDNGTGLGTSPPKKAGGLANTENRIGALGGSVTFGQEEQQGASIILHVPF